MWRSKIILILFLVTAIYKGIGMAIASGGVTCTDLNEKAFAFLKCYFKNVKLIKIVTINDNDKITAMSDLTTNLYSNIVQILEVSIELQTYRLDFEEATYDITELYAWNGLRFVERDTQLKNSIMTTEGQQAIKNSNRNSINFGVIVLVDTVEILNSYLTGSVRPPFHTPKVLFLLIILEDKQKTNQMLLRELLERIWKEYGILMTVTLIGCHQERAIYYEPFTESLQTKSNKLPENWGVLRNESITTEELCQLTKKINPKSFNGYPIRTIFFEKPPTAISWSALPKSFLKSQAADARLYSKDLGGYDGLTFGNLLQALNLTSINVNINDNERFLSRENGTFGGAGIVLLSKADIVVNPHLMIDRAGGDVEFTVPLFFDSVCIIAPKSRRIPSYLSLLVSFKKSLWLFLLGFLLIVSFIWKIIQKFAFYETNIESQEFYVLTTMVLLLIYSIPLKLQRSGVAEKIFLSALLFFGIVLTGIVSGFFAMSMTTKIYYKDVNTLKELEESGLKVRSMSKTLIDLVSGYDLPAEYVSLKKSVRTTKLDSLEEVIKEGVCIIQLSTDFDILKEPFNFAYGEERLHMIPECPGAFHTAYIVRKGWPLITHFNRIITCFKESGLLLHWFHSAKRALNTKIYLENYNKLKVPIHAPLTLGNLRLSFGLLAIGYSLASILFFFERRQFKILQKDSEDSHT